MQRRHHAGCLATDAQPGRMRFALRCGIQPCHTDQFAGREYAFGRLMYYRRTLALPDILGSGIFAGASAEVGQIKDRFDGLPSPGTL